MARRATEAYLVQILRHGFLHSDPHPGNIAVSADGGLIFYDFGMMSSIVPATKERLLDVFYGIYRKDAAKVSTGLVHSARLELDGEAIAALSAGPCKQQCLACTPFIDRLILFMFRVLLPAGC